MSFRKNQKSIDKSIASRITTIVVNDGNDHVDPFDKKAIAHELIAKVSHLSFPDLIGESSFH